MVSESFIAPEECEEMSSEEELIDDLTLEEYMLNHKRQYRQNREASIGSVKDHSERLVKEIENPADSYVTLDQEFINEITNPKQKISSKASSRTIPVEHPNSIKFSILSMAGKKKDKAGRNSTSSKLINQEPRIGSPTMTRTMSAFFNSPGHPFIP